MDQNLMAQQAEIYKIPGVDDSEPALNPVKKRKEAQLEDVSELYISLNIHAV